jgi:hypothetical protein
MVQEAQVTEVFILLAVLAAAFLWLTRDVDVDLDAIFKRRK